MSSSANDKSFLDGKGANIFNIIPRLNRKKIKLVAPKGKREYFPDFIATWFGLSSFTEFLGKEIKIFESVTGSTNNQESSVHVISKIRVQSKDGIKNEGAVKLILDDSDYDIVMHYGRNSVCIFYADKSHNNVLLLSFRRPKILTVGEKLNGKKYTLDSVMINDRELYDDVHKNECGAFNLK